MNIAVRYQSRGGNTRAVAEIIAERVGVKAEAIDKPLNENVDVLFIGGGAYGWDADPQLKEYLEKLTPHKVGQIVAFSTYGAMKVTLKRIAEYANNAGIKVNEKQLSIRMFVQGHATFGLKGGNLSDTQIEEIKKFTCEVLAGFKK
jgi:flavodoxin